jgi:hypothetical protein
MADLLKAMLACRVQLYQYYPRVQVPALDPLVRTPVAAILRVWDRWDFASGPCPSCGGVAVATSFGGVMTIGSVSGCCTACGEVVTRDGGGFSWVRRCCEVATAGTSYRIPFRSFPGGWALRGEPHDLIAVLSELCAPNLPDPRALAFHRG